MRGGKLPQAREAACGMAGTLMEMAHGLAMLHSDAMVEF